MNSSIFSFRSWSMAVAVVAFFLFMEVLFRVRYFGAESISTFWKFTPISISMSEFVEKDPNPNIGYKLAPLKDGYFKGADFSTNSHGFRGKEVSEDKSPGVFRIALLGSSITMGSGVGDQQAYSSQLQFMLDEKLPNKFEVLNFAVGGYRATEISVHFWDHVERFKPDLVMLPVVNSRLGKRTKPPKNLEQLRGNHFELRQHLGGFFSLAAIRNESRDALRALRRAGWFGHARHWSNPKMNDSTKVNRKEALEGDVIHEFSSQLNKAGFSHIVFSLELIPTSEKEFKKSVGTANRREDWETEMFSEMNFRTLSDMDVAIGPEDSIYPGDNHPNARVHRLYAESIFNHIWPYLEKQAARATEKKAQP